MLATYADQPRPQFDDLVRSGATMKVSLTPERIRQPDAAFRSLPSQGPPPLSRAGSSQGSLGHVGRSKSSLCSQPQGREFVAPWENQQPQRTTTATISANAPPGQRTKSARDQLPPLPTAFKTSIRGGAGNKGRTKADLKAERMAKAAMIMEEELATEQKIEDMRQARGGGGGGGARVGGGARMHKLRGKTDNIEQPRGMFHQMESMQHSSVVVTTTHTQTTDDGLPYISPRAVATKAELNTHLPDYPIDQQDWTSESGVTSPSTDRDYSVSELSTYSPVITRRPTVPHHHHHSDAIQHATPPFLNLHHQHHPYSTSSLNQTYTSSEVYFPQPAHFSAHSHSFTDLSYPHEGKTSDSIRSVSYQGSVHSDNDTGHTLSLFELARTPTDDVDSINSKKKSISPHSSFICSPLSLASMATSLSPHSPSRSRSHRGSSDDRPDATARRSISAESSATSDVPALYHERSDSNSLSVPSSVSEGPDSPPANQSHHHPNHAPASAPPAPDLQSQLLESVCHLRADLAKTNDVIRCQQLVDAFLVQCGLGAALSEETAAELKLWRRRRRIGREESGRDS